MISVITGQIHDFVDRKGLQRKGVNSGFCKGVNSGRTEFGVEFRGKKGGFRAQLGPHLGSVRVEKDVNRVLNRTDIHTKGHKGHISLGKLIKRGIKAINIAICYTSGTKGNAPFRPFSTENVTLSGSDVDSIGKLTKSWI